MKPEPEKTDTRREVKRLQSGSALSLSANIASVGLGVLLQLVLAWAMPNPAEMGVVFATLSMVALVQMVLLQGLDAAATKFVPRYWKAQDWNQLHQFNKYATKRIFCVAAIAIIVGIGVVFALPYEHLHHRGAWLIAVLLLLPIPQSIFRQSLLRAIGRPVVGLMPESILKPIFVGAIVWGLIQTKTSPATCSTVLIGYLSGSLIAWGIGLAIQLRLVPQHHETPAEKSSDRDGWADVAKASFVVAVASAALGQFDLLALHWLQGEEESGLYGPAAKIATLALLGINAVNMMLGPMLSKSTEDRAQLELLARKGAWISLSLATIATLLIWVGAELLLRLYGAEYVESATCLRILTFGNWLNAATGSVGLLLILTGHHHLFARILVAAAVLHAGLCFVAASFGGRIEVAIVTTVTIVFWNSWAWLEVRRRIQINPAAFGKPAADLNRKAP